MSKEKKTPKELIADVFDSAPKVFDSAAKKEPNAFEVFDDPTPTVRKENESVPTATWNPNIMNTIFGDPVHTWTITSINTTTMPMVPVNMQFNLNCIRKGDNVVVTIWHYENAVRGVVSQAILNGEISEITPDRMVISVINPLNSDNTEIIITPSDMIDNDHCKYTINCGSTCYYPNTWAINQVPQF